MRLLSGFLQFIFMDISKKSSKDRALESIQGLLKVQVLLHFFFLAFDILQQIIHIHKFGTEIENIKEYCICIQSFLAFSQFPIILKCSSWQFFVIFLSCMIFNSMTDNNLFDELHATISW